MGFAGNVGREGGWNRPFACSEYPAGDDPERQHEHDEHGAGADGHEGLENEPRVELYPVECTDTARRRVGEETTVQ